MHAILSPFAGRSQGYRLQGQGRRNGKKAKGTGLTLGLILDRLKLQQEKLKHWDSCLGCTLKSFSPYNRLMHANYPTFTCLLPPGPIKIQNQVIQLGICYCTGSHKEGSLERVSGAIKKDLLLTLARHTNSFAQADYPTMNSSSFPGDCKDGRTTLFYIRLFSASRQNHFIRPARLSITFGIG